jgi:hypothetical protein
LFVLQQIGGRSENDPDFVREGCERLIPQPAVAVKSMAGGSGPGPSLNVSRISRSRDGPRNTSDGQLGTQPASLAVWSISSLGVVGNTT